MDISLKEKLTDLYFKQKLRIYKRKDKKSKYFDTEEKNRVSSETGINLNIG